MKNLNKNTDKTPFIQFQLLISKQTRLFTDKFSRTTTIHPGIFRGRALWADSVGAYYLARKSGNFGLKSNGKVIFRKFHSEIVEYLQRYSSFSVFERNGGNFLTICKTFQFPVSHQPKTMKGNRILQMVSAISFGWFGDFGKSLTINQRLSQPDYSDKW